MHLNQWIVIACLSMAATAILGRTDYLRVCYYTNWSVYRHGNGKYNLKDHYEKGLCTHIIYSFAKVAKVPQGGYGIIPYEAHDQGNNGGYAVLNKQLKNEDKNLKTLLAVGGWTHASDGFKQMVTDKETRALFIKNSIEYLETHGFDGLDLDWEYPAQRGSTSGDREKFSKLCEELKAAYKPKSLLVTAAVAAGAGSVDVSYEVAKISNSLDFINLMTYDLHGSWERNVGHHTDTNPNRPYPSQHSLYNTVNHWIRKGAPKEKLILGLASYGRTWKLKDACNDWNLGGTGAWTGGLPGKYTSESGFLAYYEICRKDWKQRVCTQKSSVKAPYGTDGRDFIGYDDEESIIHKINNVMIAKGLGGFMFWALDLDDFGGHCDGKIKYPLIKAAKNAAMRRSQAITKCTSKTTTKCEAPITKRPTPKEVGENGCRLNEYGPWRTRSDIDTWCKNPQNCGPGVSYCGENYPGCTTCMCICEDSSTAVKPTTKQKPTQTPKPNETQKPTATNAPVSASNCKPQPLYALYPSYNDFCTSRCHLCGVTPWLKTFCICPETTPTCKAKKPEYKYHCDEHCNRSSCEEDYWMQYYCHC